MEQFLPFLSSEGHPLQILALAAGALAVWLLARWKSLAEIRVLRSDLAAHKVSLFEKLIALDEKQRHIVRSLDDALRQTLEALRAQDAVTARQCREEAVNTFLLDYVGSYFQYAGLGRWAMQDERSELIDDELIPFLETSAQVRQQLNRSDLLQLTGAMPLTVADCDFGFALRFVRRYTRPWHWQRRRKIDEAVKLLFVA